VAGDYMAGALGLGYQDAADELTEFYQLLVMGAPALHGVRVADFRPELLPPAHLFEQHTFGIGVGMLNGPDGILVQYYSPFGAAGGPMAGIGQMASMYTRGMVGAPVLAGVLMPALVRARSTARRVACSSNLRQIGLGLTVYKTERGRWPERLAALSPDYLQGAAVFRCPTDPHPERTEGGVPMSYRYVGRLRPQLEPEVILVFDKRGNHPDGRNVLFADTHVEFLSEPEFARRMQRSLELLKEAGWDEYGPERQEKIEEFYRRYARP
jgi:prepilin-type processing-associated H-X9-DG protein